MSRYRETMAEALKKVYEDGHEDVSSSKRMCQTIIEDATQIRTKLDSMSAEDKLDTWWTNKLAKSADNLNSARDYIMNPIEEELQERTYDPIQFGPDKVAKAMAIATKSSGQYSVAVRDIEKIARNLSKVSTIARELKKQNEEVELDEARIISDISGISIPKLKKEAQPFNVKVDRVGPGMDSDYEVEFTGSEPNLIKYAKKHLGFDGNNFSQLKRHLAMEEVEIEEGKMKTIATMFDQGQSAKEIAKALKLPLSTVKSILGEGINPYVSMQKDDKTGRTKYVVLDKDEKEAFSSFEYKVAQDYMKKNYNKLKEQLDEKIADSIIKDLQKAYGDLKGKTISPEMANKISKHLDGQSFDVGTLRQLTKAKIPFISTIARNKIYKKTGKFEELEEASAQQIAKKAHELGVSATVSKKGIDISGFKTQAGMDKFMKYIASQGGSMINLAKMGMKRNFEAVEEPMPKEEPKKDNEKKESENKDKQIAALKDQISMLKTKIENEKNKAVKPEPNPNTGEVPLTVGVAYKHFKDKAKKEVKEESLEEMSPAEKKKRLQRAKDMIKYYDMMKKRALKGPNKALAKKMLKNDIEEADLSKKQIKMVHKVADDLPKKDFKDRYGKEKGDAVRFGTATNMVKKKLGMKEDRRLYVETIAGLKKKAEKSGMPYSILKKVYDRGMAAWKSGHRPGASQQQWAFARVNSFVTKSSGTWGGADKDLAKQVRGSN